MRLKWLPVRLRRRRRGLAAARLLAARRSGARRPICTSAGSRPTAVAPGPEGRRGKVAPRPRGELTARRLVAPGRRLRRCASLRTEQRRPPRGGWAAPVRRKAAGVTACSGASTVQAGREVGRTLRCGRWCPNGRIRPVLKHGPRSATCVRVPGWQTRRRNESEGGALSARCGESPFPPPGGGGASSTDPCVTLWRDLSESVPVATRKMVNYA